MLNWLLLGRLLSRLNRLLSRLLSLAARSPQQLKVLNEDLSHITLDGIAVFPHAGSQLTLDIKLCAFADILLGHLGMTAPHDDVVPLGAFRHLV